MISTLSDAKGALPLVHERDCVVIKLHGDYLSTTIRNTESELAKYSAPMKKLLTQILNDFGLAICGWSADWDHALREAVAAASNRRFPRFWVDTRPLAGKAEVLARNVGAVNVQMDADTFFRDTAERVLSLRELERPHPLTVETAVASLKRYIPEPRHRIRLHDLVTEECERTYAAIADDDRFPVQGDDGEYLKNLRHYEAATATLEQLVATGCHFGESVQDHLWIQCVNRLLNIPDSTGPYNVEFKRLRRYPALRLVYAGGIAALAGKRPSVTHKLLDLPQLRSSHSDEHKVHVSWLLNPNNAISKARLQAMGTDHLLAANHRLCETMRSSLGFCAPDHKEYESAFDQFEYLLTCNFIFAQEGPTPNFIPHGLFSLKLRRSHMFGGQAAIWTSLESNLAEILEAGFLGNSLDEYRKVRQVVESWIAEAHHLR